MIWKNKAGMVFGGVLDAMTSECRKHEECADCPICDQGYCADESDAAEILGLKPVFLKHNEHIASVNAVVVVDDEDNVTGWWDNDTRMVLIHAAPDINAGDKEVGA